MFFSRYSNIFQERFQTSKTTTLGRPQNKYVCQNVAPIGSMFWHRYIPCIRVYYQAKIDEVFCLTKSRAFSSQQSCLVRASEEVPGASWDMPFPRIRGRRISIQKIHDGWIILGCHWQFSELADDWESLECCPLVCKSDRQACWSMAKSHKCNVCQQWLVISLSGHSGRQATNHSNMGVLELQGSATSKLYPLTFTPP